MLRLKIKNIVEVEDMYRSWLRKKYPSLFLILDTYLKILIIKQSKLI